MRYDADRKHRTREQVLKAAIREIRASGAHRLAVAGVMAKAGLTHGGFYAHFDSKDDLVASAIDQMFEAGLGRLKNAHAGRTPAQALTAYIDLYVSTRHRDSSTGCPIPVLASDLPHLAKTVRQRFALGVTRLIEALAGLLTRFGRERAKEEARSMLSEMVGALALARAEPDPQQSNYILEASRRSLKSRFGLDAATLEGAV
jgi:TetR/AcrR family transcriptional regulator, transcriptional repressor for nem operon